MTAKCDGCGASQREWYDDDGATLTLCKCCGDECCNKCAGSFEVDGGYGREGRDVRVWAFCAHCKAQGHTAKPDECAS